jgi:hypothetical protein
MDRNVENTHCTAHEQLTQHGSLLHGTPGRDFVVRARVMGMNKSAKVLAAEENRILPDGLAADFHLVGGEIGVGIANRQAGQDR